MIDPRYIGGSVAALTFVNLAEFVMGSPYIVEAYILGAIVATFFLSWLWSKIDTYPKLAAILTAIFGGFAALTAISLITFQFWPIIFVIFNLVMALVLIKYSLGKVAHDI